MYAAVYVWNTRSVHDRGRRSSFVGRAKKDDDGLSEISSLFV